MAHLVVIIIVVLISYDLIDILKIHMISANNIIILLFFFNLLLVYDLR